MFTSKQPGQFPRDPHPYVWAHHSPRDKTRVDTDMFRRGGGEGLVRHFDYEYMPRPEFNTPVNRILQSFRLSGWTEEKYREPGQTLGTGARLWLDNADVTFFTWIPDATDSEVEHARKVLTHLVRLEEAE